MFTLVRPAQAQVNISNLSFPGMKVPASGSIADLLTGSGFNLVTFIFFIAGAIFFFNLLNAAWDYLLSTGDPKKVQSATTRLLNAFLGFVVVLSSFVVIRVLTAIIGVPNII